MLLNFGMGALGTLLGFMMAWSGSPVVTTALPLLFGLLGGAGGFSLAKVDLSKPNNQAKVALIGSSLLYLSSTCLIALVIGILSKPLIIDRYYEIVSGRYYLTDKELQDGKAALTAITFRKRLEAVGASNSEITSFVGKRRSNNSADIQSYLDKFSAAASAFVTEADKLSPEAKKAITSGDIRFINSGSDAFSNLYVFAKLYLIESPLSADPDTNHLKDLMRNFYSFDFSKINTEKILLPDLRLVSAVMALRSLVETGRSFIPIDQDTSEIAKLDGLISLLPTKEEAQKESRQLVTKYTLPGR